MIRPTSLDRWVREKIGVGPDSAEGDFAEALRSYQLEKLNETIDYARNNAPFYRQRLAFLPNAPLSTLSDLAGIPFTTPSDLVLNPSRFVAVRQDEIARIVTLRTSGSTGDAKRLFFTEPDLELTVDFFHRGMSTLVQPGKRAAVLLPCERPDSVGDLLVRGLRRMDVEALPYGPVTEPLRAARAITDYGAHCLVGNPTQVLAVAYAFTELAIGKGAVESVLLSTDYVPRSIVATLEGIWDCRVFTHYGMTEMGLGGGVECEALDGYHLREGDLFFEIVDHETGEPCPDGVEGEVVFTTLTRRGMPLIRYRTGDISRMIPYPCPCGSSLRRMDRVRGRWDGLVDLAPCCALSLAETDEALFGLSGLLDYRLTIIREAEGRSRLHVVVCTAEGMKPAEHRIMQALRP